jgi:hypothetical protein
VKNCEQGMLSLVVRRLALYVQIIAAAAASRLKLH